VLNIICSNHQLFEIFFQFFKGKWGCTFLNEWNLKKCWMEEQIKEWGAFVIKKIDLPEPPPPFHLVEVQKQLRLS
jgi:hypothetical protein